MRRILAVLLVCLLGCGGGSFRGTFGSGNTVFSVTGLLDGRAAALPCARTGKHSEAATDPRGGIQFKPDPAQTTGRGHAPGVEEPLRQACFDPLLTLYVSDKSEAALQKPNLCVCCQVLR